jgi:hypothetical protein
MALRSRTPETELDPMLPEQFELARAATQIRTPKLIEACRAVLVDHEAAPDIAAKLNIEVSSIYRATASIRQKWDEICTSEEWDYIPLAIPRTLTDVVLTFQRELLKGAGDRKPKSSKRKRK